MKRVESRKKTLWDGGAYVAAVKQPAAQCLDSNGGGIGQCASQQLDIDIQPQRCYSENAFTHAEDKAMLESNQSAV